jgi:hypothetical protein
VGGCSVVDIYGVDTAFRLQCGTRYRFKDLEDLAIIMMVLLQCCCCLRPDRGPFFLGQPHELWLPDRPPPPPSPRSDAGRSKSAHPNKTKPRQPFKSLIVQQEHTPHMIPTPTPSQRPVVCFPPSTPPLGFQLPLATLASGDVLSCIGGGGGAEASGSTS